MQKIGLVFSGGGGKGAYEVGVWQALEEFGLAKDIYAVSGTSVGALNAALFAQGDLDKAKESWLSMSPSDILSIDATKILPLLIKHGINPSKALSSILVNLAKHGVFSRKGLLRIIQDYLSKDLLTQSKIPCFACATKLTTVKAKYFKLQDYSAETVDQILLASSAIPFIFPMEKVEGSAYWDGFIKDNTPIKPLYDLGCDIIITVLMSRDALVNKNDFPNSKIIEIYPQDAPGGALAFKNSKQKMQNGYDDAKQMLGPVFDLMDINCEYSGELLKYKKIDQDINHSLNELKTKNGQLEHAKSNLFEEMEKWNTL